jgi:RimJ/RimL family protein N-acetyltransferase
MIPGLQRGQDDGPVPSRVGRRLAGDLMIAGKLVDLRPVEAEDLDFLRLLHNDPAVAMSVVDWAPPVSAMQHQRWFDGLPTDRSSLRLTVVERATSEPVGLTGLWDINHREGFGWSGIKMSPTSGGRGLATDAVMATMAWAFGVAELRRLESSMLDFNRASHALYVSRCGWVVEGRERQKVLRGGRYCDLVRIAILRSEFEALAGAEQYLARVLPVDTRAFIAPESW